MNILFAAARNAWGGFLDLIQAELGIYMMIGLSRDLHGMARSMRNRKMGEPQGKALLGKKVGIIYNVIATPHIAGSTDVSVQGIVKVVAENIIRVEMNKAPLYTNGAESIHELIEKQRDNAKEITTDTL